MGRKAQAREAILSAARMLFWRKGYGAVGVDEICQAAGVNKGSLYHYHRDKTDLACAVIESNAAVLFENIATNLAERAPAPRVLGYLDWMIAGQVSEGRDSGQFAGCPFGKLAAETAGQEPEIRAAVLAVFQKLIKFIAAALRELDPARPSGEHRARAEEIFMSWQGALVLSQTRNSQQPLRRCRQATAAALADYAPK
ncbi:MAG: TetR/AcrR family transcriptional regulator [bacterium]|nr:TetR/AcrR family transcriptional regulator [bacterium]